MSSDLTLYWYGASSPSRAVKIFLEINKIPHKETLVDLQKGEHKTPSYLKVSPRGVVPAITDGEFNLSESATVLRYLSTTRKVADHWYPADPKKRARVDEALDWNHTGLRQATIGVAGPAIFARVANPSTPLNKEAFDGTIKKLNEQYAFVEERLKKTNFIAGDEISIADLQYACEVEFHQLWKGDISAYLHLVAWLKRVRELDDASWKQTHAAFNQFVGFTTSALAW